MQTHFPIFPAGWRRFNAVVAADVCASWCAALDGCTALFGPSGLEPRAVLDDVVRGELRRHCVAALGSAALACDLDQCWVRRQPPSGEAAHSWHQDGALRFDFAALNSGPAPADALLRMLTCWIPLLPCGRYAPGLELVDACPGGLLLPEALTDAAVRSRHAPNRFVRPVLAAGDALVFAGDVLHRTHVDAGMNRDRLSIELRLFGGEVPPRLRGERFFALGDEA